jgi:hypothetical protein
MDIRGQSLSEAQRYAQQRGRGKAEAAGIGSRIAKQRQHHALLTLRSNNEPLSKNSLCQKS